MISGKFLLGLLAGAAIGAAAGVLFAPDKGSATRKKLLSAGDDYADALKGRLEGVIDTIGEKYEKGKEATKGLVSDIKTKTVGARNDGTDGAY